MNITKVKGIVLKGVGGLYGVRSESIGGNHETIICHARGKFRHEAISPLPGDDVIIARDVRDNTDASADYVIDEILPRRSTLIRPPSANLTHLFLLVPAACPKPDLLTADKITSIAEHQNIETVVIAAKSDIDPAAAEDIAAIYRRAGYSAFSLSAKTGCGIDVLMDFIGKISVEGSERGIPVRAAFAGASGAGKSTLMTKMFPQLKLRTGALSQKTERGRHTTRHVELYPIESIGGSIFFLADTPGFSMLDFTKYNYFPPSELSSNFREFSNLLGTCKYTKCTHIREEGCAVIEAVKIGKIGASRHESYKKIFEELKAKPEWKRIKEEMDFHKKK